MFPSMPADKTTGLPAADWYPMATLQPIEQPFTSKSSQKKPDNSGREGSLTPEDARCRPSTKHSTPKQQLENDSARQSNRSFEPIVGNQSASQITPPDSDFLRPC